MALEQQLLQLQYAVEQFDLNQASLSLQPGRFHNGRRRELHITPIPRKAFAWVELLIFTNDRYERSLVEHLQMQDSVDGSTVFTVNNAGNVPAPPLFSFVPDGVITLLQISLSDVLLVLERTVSAGQTVLVDSQERQVRVDDERSIPGREEYPMLAPASIP